MCKHACDINFYALLSPPRRRPSISIHSIHTYLGAINIIFYNATSNMWFVNAHYSPCRISYYVDGYSIFDFTHRENNIIIFFSVVITAVIMPVLFCIKLQVIAYYYISILRLY